VRPGGVLVIADVIAPAAPSGWQLAADAWDAAVRRRVTNLRGPREAITAFEDERWNMFRYFDPRGIDHPSTVLDQLLWLRDAGFVDVDVYWLGAGHAIFGGSRAAR
jgi:tRNA (cmo5U34)-methyltransferase